MTSLFTVYAVFCKEIYLLNRKKTLLPKNVKNAIKFVWCLKKCALLRHYNYDSELRNNSILPSPIVCTIYHSRISNRFWVKLCLLTIGPGPVSRSTRSLGPPQTRVKKQETRIKKQNGLAHLRFLVCVTPKQKTKKNIAWFENQVFSETCVN